MSGSLILVSLELVGEARDPTDENPLIWGLTEIIRARVVWALRVTRGRSSLGWDDRGTKAL